MTVGDGATAAHRGPVDWPISISQLFRDLMRITESRDPRCCQPLSGTGSAWGGFTSMLGSAGFEPPPTDGSNIMEKVDFNAFDSRAG